MNINVNAAASVAGTARAAARGGEADAQAAEATRQQANAETPTGKVPDASAVDAGDQTSDRDGHGQQVLDVFERSKRNQQEATAEEEQEQKQDAADHPASPAGDDRGHHLDLEA